MDGRRGPVGAGRRRPADHRVRVRPGAERDRRLGGPAPHGRDARRGDRSRARQQGVAGRRRRARHRAGAGDRGRDHPCRLRAFGAASAARLRAPRNRRPSGPDRLGRPIPRPQARRPRERHDRSSARPPDLGDGRQDHDRLGDVDEQGARADRGPPPVRYAVRADRHRRPPAVDHPQPDPAVRRRHARASRVPRHARADLLRAAPPRAGRRPRAPARSGRGGEPDIRARGRGDVQLRAHRPRRRARGRHRDLHDERRQRDRRARVSRRAPAVPGYRAP